MRPPTTPAPESAILRPEGKARFWLFVSRHPVAIFLAALTLAMMEAVTGTLYMAVLVARLVSLYSAAAPAPETGAREGP